MISGWFEYLTVKSIQYLSRIAAITWSRISGADCASYVIELLAADLDIDVGRFGVAVDPIGRCGPEADVRRAVDHDYPDR